MPPKKSAKKDGKKRSSVVVSTPLGPMLIVDVPEQDLSSMKSKALMERCKSLKIKGCSGKTKDELRTLIRDHEARHSGQTSMKLAPSKKGYAGHTLAELKKMCKERGIDAKSCALKKAEVVAVLDAWDKALKSPSPRGRKGKSPAKKSKKAKSPSPSSSPSPSPSPVRKAKKSKSPAKAKKSPVKKAKAPKAKKSPAKKAKSPKAKKLATKSYEDHTAVEA